MSENDTPTPRRRPPWLAGALVLLAAAGLGAAAWAAGVIGGPASFHGTAYLPPEPAAPFRLTDHTGRELALSDLRGRGVLLFFGYTHCPDVCPLTLAKLSRVLRAMEADSGEVRVLLVTVDPARDTPEALAAYVRRFGPLVTGLTGDSAALAGLRARYAVHAAPQPGGGGHLVSHTGAVFGIDREGRIRVLLPMERPDEVVAEDVRALLRS